MSHAYIRRTIEQFTIRDPEEEIRNSDSIQDIAGLRIDDGSSNGHGHGNLMITSPQDSNHGPAGRLLIEDGSAYRPTRTNSGRLY
jgi:hypothetical protein